MLSCGFATHYFSSKVCQQYIIYVIYDIEYIILLQAGWDGLEKLEEELSKVAANPEGDLFTLPSTLLWRLLVNLSLDSSKHHVSPSTHF